jgi:hypothetical protein
MTKKSKTGSKTGGTAKLSTTAQFLGAQNFEPWEGKFDADAFSEAMERHRVNGHLAIGVMHSTKEKLMVGFQEVPDTLVKLTEAISDSVDGLRALADSMDAARLRLLSACAAVHC